MSDPAYRMELILLNNPEGVFEAMVQAGVITDTDQVTEDVLRDRINELLLQERTEELKQIFAVVPVIPEALTPNAITALNTLPKPKSQTGPLMENGEFYQNPPEDEGGFDWGNMAFWGSILSGVGGLFGQVGQQQNPQPQPQPQPNQNRQQDRPTFWERVQQNQVLIIGALALVALAVYLSNRK